eukprot:GEZU01004089.1.p1 GENE.GEZU01004089.1~~GEZU01004089.1.p1  ORF type:complete len:538 (+),score=174.10 GEZU01004089.1:28-1641(+)
MNAANGHSISKIELNQDGQIVSGSEPSHFTQFNNKAFFVAKRFAYPGEPNDQPTTGLWSTDGTTANTVLLANDEYKVRDPSDLTVFGSKMIFAGFYFPQTKGADREPWISDGTPAGTRPLANVNPDSHSNPRGFAVVGNKVFFAATDADHGYELFNTDGTSNGTKLVKDIYPGVNNSNPEYITSVNDQAVFAATDHENGREIFASDGTLIGTGLLADINPGSADSNPHDFVALRGAQLFFVATNDATGTELYSSDGTTWGTFLVKDIAAGVASSNPSQLTNINDEVVFFVADDGVHGAELWKSDGSAAGTVMVRDIYPGASGSSITGLTYIPEVRVAYFTATDGIHGMALWRSDGTLNGTVMLSNDTTNANQFIGLGSNAYFVASDDKHGAELHTFAFSEDVIVNNCESTARQCDGSTVCCDPTTCSFRPTTYLCRNGTNDPCAMSDTYCSGTNAECIADYSQNNGNTCDDGNSCTINDKCMNGVCNGTQTCTNGDSSSGDSESDDQNHTDSGAAGMTPTAILALVVLTILSAVQLL